MEDGDGGVDVEEEGTTLPVALGRAFVGDGVVADVTATEHECAKLLKDMSEATWFVLELDDFRRRFLRPLPLRRLRPPTFEEDDDTLLFLPLSGVPAPGPPAPGPPAPSPPAVPPRDCRFILRM